MVMEKIMEEQNHNQATSLDSSLFTDLTIFIFRVEVHGQLM